MITFATLFVLVRLATLVVLLRVLVVTENWLLCGGVYALVVAVLDLLFSEPVAATALHAGLGFALATVLFRVLVAVTSRPAWWTTAVVGLAVALV